LITGYFLSEKEKKIERIKKFAISLFACDRKNESDNCNCMAVGDLLKSSSALSGPLALLIILNAMASR